MTKLYRPVLLVLGLCFSAVLYCFAGDSTQSWTTVRFSDDVSALYQAASAITTPIGTDISVIDDDESYVFDAEGKAVHSRYVLYKILTQKGADEWGGISLNWEPWREELPSVRARVITPDNAVHILDPKTVTDAPAKEENDEIYSDRRVIRAPLPAIAPGSLVEHEETTKESRLFFAAGTVGEDSFGRPVPIHFSRLILDASTSLPIRYKIQLLPDMKTERREDNGRVQLVFSEGPMEPLEEADSNLPSDIPSYPSIKFSTGNSWQQVAAEYGKIADAQIALSDVKPIVSKVTSGKVSPQEKAAAILDYLDREVRYTGVEFGEAAIAPGSPAETLKRKYGDCKDKASLLVAMLRAAGIPSYLALLNAGSREDVSPELPGMGLFDHAIVYVPGSPDLWIDATDEYARLGQVPADDQGRLALIVRADSNSLVRIPETTSPENLLVEKREFYLAEQGPARVVEISEPHGSLESVFRSAYTDPENRGTHKDLNAYFQSQYLAEKLDHVDRSDPNDKSKPFTLDLETAHAKRGFTDLEIAVAAIRLDTLFNRLPGDLQQRAKEEEKGASATPEKAKKPRTADYQLPQAFVTEWEYTIVPPPGFQSRPLPADATIALGPAQLTESFSADAAGVVKATIRFDSVNRRFTPSGATEMRDKITQLRDGPPILIYFEPVGETLLNAGKIRESFQSYRGIVALHPNDAVPHLRMAKALLAAGMGQAARDEARVAVKLEPASALAQKTLGEILEYDSVGRRFRPASDYPGAEAAYRAAEKLDPADNAAVANLAILLEYNRWGLRYGPGARLRDAVAEYRKLTAENLAQLGLQNNLAFALFYAGEFSEARKNAETLNPQPSALIVACEAAVNGSRAALAEARKRSTGDEQFNQVVESAADLLENLRHYPLAADLMEAGASGANASGVAAEAITIRKMQLHEQINFPDDATGIAMHFSLLESDPELTLNQIRSISSRSGNLGLAVPRVVDLLAKEANADISSKARRGLFADVGVDLSLARAQPILEGNDGTGYKITLFPSASYKRFTYVVKEGGKYKVLATSQFVAGIGLEVLDRVAANDLVGARALLDWLREDEHLAGGDDPLAGAPFPRFWTKGKVADAGTMQLAAAAILTETKETAARSLAVLERAGDSAHDEAEKLNIELALLNGYDSLEEYDKALAVCLSLSRQYPDSLRVFFNEVFDLRVLGRFDEADRLAEDRLQRTPGDIDATHALIASAALRGDYVKAHALGQKLLVEGKATASDLNDIAWHSLFTGKAEGTDLEAALKASQLSSNNTSMLHTLGCVYAEFGKVKESRDVLIQAMDQLNLDGPDSNYWYAFGRVAEQYGEIKVAIADYNRVEKPKLKIAEPDSSYRLAENRLAVLASSRETGEPAKK